MRARQSAGTTATKVVFQQPASSSHRGGKQMAQHRDPRTGDGSSVTPPPITQTAGGQQRTTTEKEHSSVPTLVRQLTSEVTSLFTKEISLARSEMRESVNQAKAGAIAMTSGGIVLLAGTIILLMAAVYGLATVLSLWLSALIVGGVVCLIGFIMLKSGQ